MRAAGGDRNERGGQTRPSLGAHTALSGGAPDAAIGHGHGAVAALGECDIVGDEEQRSAAPLFQREEKLQDFVAGGGVEIAGGLVCEDQRRAGFERAGQSDALLLAAGELSRKVTL